MPKTGRLIGMLTAAALVALLPASAGAAGGVATITAGGDAVVWQPQVAGYDRLVLTVAGPGGTVTREFQRGESPSFSLFDAAGSVLADGAYKWELRVVPHLDDAAKKALVRDREAGSTATVDALRAAGVIPAESYQAGAFSVIDGALVLPGDFQEAASASGGATSQGAGAMTPLPSNVVLTNGDGVIRNSLCVGLDCPDAPVFSDSTILLMENNTRIKFGDTSNSPFPNNDWEIEANSANSGGQSYLGFNDCGSADNDGGCATDLVFAVEAGARQSALYVESDGDIGIGTSNPVTDLHIVTGNTPTIRLDQDGSSGFAPQVWDVAGNETNFFIRDVTGGSRLPFRSFPGAPSNSLDITANGDVGMGTASPAGPLHVVRSGSSGLMMQLEGAGDVFFRQKNSTSGQFVDVNLIGDEFRINFGTGGAGPELRLTNTGNLIITGTYTPDYVFDPTYKLMPIEELATYVDRERHLPNVPNAEDVKKNGIVVNNFPMQLLEKIEELTLYTIDQHQQLTDLTAENSQLKARLEALEKLVGTAPATQPE